MSTTNHQSNEPDDEPIRCKVCGTELEWVDCDECGGDGEIDESEEDPINFAPGEEYRPCALCKGQGGWLECPNLPHDKPEQEHP